MLSSSLMPLYTAGEVRRFHTMRLLHPQTIAEHTWGVVLVILWLYDIELPSAALLRAATLHDVPECSTGDVPAQVKWGHTDLREIYETLERGFLADHGVAYQDLSEMEKRVLSFADIAELVMFSAIEIAMGNVRMGICMERGLQRMREMVRTGNSTGTELYQKFPRVNELLQQMEDAWHGLS